MTALYAVVKNNAGFAFWILGRNQGYVWRESKETLAEWGEEARDWIGEMYQLVFGDPNKASD